MKENKRIETARNILRDAGRLIIQHLGKSEGFEKEPGHILAPIDSMVNTSIFKAIRKHYPFDSIVTEEKISFEGENEYLWIVDPVDGTSNLRLGIPYISTAIAIQHEGVTQMALVFNPFLDEMFTAQQGKGAYLNGKRIYVSDEPNLQEGYYVQGYGTSISNQLEILRVLLPQSRRILNTWAPTLDWCNVARGKAQFLVGFNTEVEDMIQGQLILEEAGGKVTTWSGDSLAIDIRTQKRVSFVAGNCTNQKTICRYLQELQAF